MKLINIHLINNYPLLSTRIPNYFINNDQQHINKQDLGEMCWKCRIWNWKFVKPYGEYYSLYSQVSIKRASLLNTYFSTFTVHYTHITLANIDASTFRRIIGGNFPWTSRRVVMITNDDVILVLSSESTGVSQWNISGQ